MVDNYGRPSKNLCCAPVSIFRHLDRLRAFDVRSRSGIQPLKSASIVRDIQEPSFS